MDQMLDIVDFEDEMNEETDAPNIEAFANSSIKMYLKEVGESVNSNPGRSPAVSIEDSVHDDYLICLEDGKKLQMLKRHLKTVYNMTVDQYKERWGLSADYPVVAPSYAKRRSNIAKTTGLGSGKKRSRAA